MVSEERLTTPIPLPDLSHLTQAELSALRAYLTPKSREARKEAGKVLMKAPKAKDLWLKTVALKEDIPPEERSAVMTEFYEEVLRHPDAFLVYAWANALSTLDRHVWDEMLRRSKVTDDEKAAKKSRR